MNRNNFGRRPSARLHLGMFAWLVMLAGCGTDHVPMSGGVTLDGQPLKIGLLVLMPIDRGAGTSTGGEIVDGHYNIAAAKGPTRGLEYSVSISSVDRTGAAPRDIVPNLIPPEYNEKTTLRVTIPPDASNFEHDFELTSQARAIAK